MMLSRRRWLVVALALVAVALVELAVDTVLDPLLPFPASTLLVMATIAAVGIAGAILRELAIREERERIAREMHDGLAQVLGYVNTKTKRPRGQPRPPDPLNPPRTRAPRIDLRAGRGCVRPLRRDRDGSGSTARDRFARRG